MPTEIPLTSFVLGTGESVVTVTVKKPHVTTGVRGLRPMFAKSPLMKKECPSEVRTGQSPRVAHSVLIHRVLDPGFQGPDHS